jgi:hypothetical protein
MPAEATVDTPRQVTHIAATRYGPLFKNHGDGGYRHDWVSDMEVTGGLWGSDVQAVTDGRIAITPIRLSAMGVESPQLRELWP